VGILPGPTTGRIPALAIVGIPLVLFLILGFQEAGSSSSSVPDTSGYGGQSGYQQPVYPATSTTDAAPQDTYSPYAEPSDTTATDTTTDTTSPTPTDSGSSTATSTASPSPSATGPASVVLAAYADIDKHDYQDAYNLGLDQNGDSEATFAAGYSTTQDVYVTIKDVGGDTVYVGLLAISTSGVQTTYEGTYTVSGGLITGASLQQVS
jgi:hypothetical protein